MNPYDLQEIFKTRDITDFATRVLGMPIHEGQDTWFKQSTCRINILKPANQWGKTTAEAIKHIYHAVCKPALDKFDKMSFEDWFTFNYKSLNFGKTYEVARGVQEAIVEITDGHYLLPDGTFNQSLLKGWAITDIWETPKLPQIVWWNHSNTLIRSYDELGASFKRLRLAFISGDECGDIPELKLFLNGTLLPRLFFFEGSVDLVGTSQPKGVEYEDLAEIAEEDMRLKGDKAQYFIISYKNNPGMAEVYQNKFMPKTSIQEIENIADPELRRQIIYGQYVDWAKHLYTWEEVNQMFTAEIPYDPETGFSEEPQANAYYIFSVDMAATEDETSCTCIKYNIRLPKADGTFKNLPHKIVFHKAWKGASLPLGLQYEMIKQNYLIFKRVSPLRTKFVYDAGSLGGKNAGEAFRSINGYAFPPKGRSYVDVKAEGMGKVKEVLGRGREFTFDKIGKSVDKHSSWGGVKASSKLLELRRQIEISSKDDDKIKNDQYTSFMQAIHFIEARAPKSGSKNKAVTFNLNRTMNYLNG